MTKEVLVSIKSNQLIGQETGEIEIINPGSFYRKNGKIYIRYEESLFDRKVSSMVMTDKVNVEISKKGVVNTNMLFRLQEKVITSYESPLGILNMGIYTDMLHITDTDNLFQVEIMYNMEFNGQFVSRNHVLIKVTPKGDNAFTLME